MAIHRSRADGRASTASSLARTTPKLVLPVGSSGARLGSAVSLVAVLLLTACSKSDKPAQPAEKSAKALTTDAGQSGAAAASTADAGGAAQVVADAGPSLQFVGVVRGVVKLAKGAKLPIAPPVLSHGVKPPSVAPCPPVDLNDQRTIALAKQTGGLSPVHLALTGMRAVPPHEPATHDLFIDACRLRPTIVGAVRGDKVRVTNRSKAAMIPTLPGDKFMRGILTGESREATIAATQVKVSCGFGSYCGETLVVATTHSLYAVTTNEGFFEIKNVPLDQDLRIHAWAPMFDVSSEPFRLSEDKREAVIDLVLRPLPPPKAPAPSKTTPPDAERGAERGPAYQ